MFQHPSQVFESIQPLYTLHLILYREAEGHFHALDRNRDVPPPPPHLSVLAAPLCPLVLDYLPLWRDHYKQVAAGHWIPPFLHHRYPREKVSVKEFYLSRPVLCDTAGQPVTGHLTNVAEDGEMPGDRLSGSIA